MQVTVFLYHVGLSSSLKVGFSAYVLSCLFPRLCVIGFGCVRRMAVLSESLEIAHEIYCAYKMGSKLTYCEDVLVYIWSISLPLVVIFQYSWPMQTC